MMVFLQGLMMGLIYVAPIGMQNIFVINSALNNGLRRAVLTAFIVIFFDVTLALACFFGIGVLIERYAGVRMAVSLIGSLTVLFIGIRLILSKPDAISEENTPQSVWKTVSSACVVTWFNPQAIIDGTMFLGAFRASMSEDEASIFISGVASASTLWFLVVSIVISLFSRHFSQKAMKVMNIVCGCIIIVYGVRLLGSFISNFHLK